VNDLITDYLLKSSQTSKTCKKLNSLTYHHLAVWSIGQSLHDLCVHAMLQVLQKVPTN